MSYRTFTTDDTRFRIPASAIEGTVGVLLAADGETLMVRRSRITPRPAAHILVDRLSDAGWSPTFDQDGSVTRVYGHADLVVGAGGTVAEDPAAFEPLASFVDTG